MSTSLNFDFAVDKSTNTVNIKKEFDADHQLVWDAFTKKELLDQWWAPQPYTVKTKSMKFREGGKWHYAMCGPKGDKHWCLANYTSITPKSNFKYWDGFCDEKGVLNSVKPQSDWDLAFIDQGESTLVEIKIRHKTLDDLEKIIKMGFKEGFAIAINGLEELLLTYK